MRLEPCGFQGHLTELEATKARCSFGFTTDADELYTFQFKMG